MSTIESDSPKYPNITVRLTGGSGNAGVVMDTVVRALREEGVPKGEVDAYRAESMSGDYDHLLRTAMAWVDVK